MSTDQPTVTVATSSSIPVTTQFEAVYAFKDGVYGLLIRPTGVSDSTAVNVNTYRPPAPPKKQQKTILPKIQPLSVGVTQPAEVVYESNNFNQAGTSDQYQPYMDQFAMTAYHQTDTTTSSGTHHQPQHQTMPKPQLGWESTSSNNNHFNDLMMMTSATTSSHHHQQQPAPATNGTPDSGVHSVTGSPMTPMLISPRNRPDSPRVFTATNHERASFDDMPRLAHADAQIVQNAAQNQYPRPDSQSTNSDNPEGKSKILVINDDDPALLAATLKQSLNAEQLKILQKMLKSDKTKSKSDRKRPASQTETPNLKSELPKQRGIRLEMAENLARFRIQKLRRLNGLSIDDLTTDTINNLSSLINQCHIDGVAGNQTNAIKSDLKMIKELCAMLKKQPVPTIESHLNIPKKSVNHNNNNGESKRKQTRFPTAPVFNIVTQGLSKTAFFETNKIAPLRRATLNDVIKSSPTKNYQLPYDCWFDRQCQYLDPSRTYRKLKQNVYIDALPREKQGSKATCPCKEKCGDNCVNRQLNEECTSHNCQALHCTNRRLQQLSEVGRSDGHRYVERFDTKTARGSGIRAIRRIPKRTLVGEYTGEVISTTRLEQRLKTCYSTFKHHYGVNVGSKLVIDAYLCGNLMRYINHSCEPNCVMEKWLVDGRPRVAIFTKREIQEGVELTYDYSFLSNDKVQKCLCNSLKCRRFLSSPNSQSATLTMRQKAFIRDNCVFLLRSRQKDARKHNCIKRRKKTGMRPKNDLAASSKNNARTSHGDVIISHGVDLSYITEADAKCPVNSYDADRGFDDLPSSASGDNQVRCVCGQSDDDGDMAACDNCNYWLHTECAPMPKSESAKYICYFCSTCVKRPPLQCVELVEAPELAYKGIPYYRALVSTRRGLQIRLNECVYVKKMNIDEYNRKLKKFNDIMDKFKGDKMKIQNYPPRDEDNGKNTMTGKSFCRTDLRVLRIHRLFIAPDGSRYAFGNYYARPHETFCEMSRRFYKNELIQTPLYDTVPINSIVGRCLVIDSSVYCKGRPKAPQYKDEDIFVCDLRVDKAQRIFERITNKTKLEHCNTESYLFGQFAEKLTIKRDFTPFLLSSSKSETSVAKTKKTPQKNSPRLQKILKKLVNRATP